MWRARERPERVRERSVFAEKGAKGEKRGEWADISQPKQGKIRGKRGNEREINKRRGKGKINE